MMQHWLDPETVNWEVKSATAVGIIMTEIAVYVRILNMCWACAGHFKDSMEYVIVVRV